MDKNGSERTTKIGSMIYYGEDEDRTNHQDPGGQFATDGHGPERIIKNHEYDFIKDNSDQKESPGSGRTIYYG